MDSIEVKKNNVRESVIDDISPGCQFYELGDYFFEVCPMNVFVTHSSGLCTTFTLDKVETRRHQGEYNPMFTTFDSVRYMAERKACDHMVRKLANTSISLTKIAAKNDYKALSAALKSRNTPHFYEELEKSVKHYQDVYHKMYQRENKKALEASYYYKQHATWTTEDGVLEYMFGDGKPGNYTIGMLESDNETKLESIICFLDDQATYLQYDKFTPQGMRAFEDEFGCMCGSDFADMMDSYARGDKAISIPVDKYPMELQEWHREGIHGDEALMLLAMGKLPEDELDEVLCVAGAMERMRRGRMVKDTEFFYKYSLNNGEVYKHRKSEGILLSKEEFWGLSCEFKDIGLSR